MECNIYSLECISSANFDQRQIHLQDRQQQEQRLIVLLGIVRQLMATREGKLFKDQPLTAPQFGVLNHFTHKPERRWTVTELADVMEMNQPGITKIVTVLVDKGLLSAVADAQDKRKRYLKITAQGLGFCKNTFQALLPDISYLFSNWNDAELDQLLVNIDKLKCWLDDHREDVKRQ